MPTCIHCFKKFRDRQTVTRHQGKDHRDLYPETAEPEPLTPIEIRVHIIPPEVIAIKIIAPSRETWRLLKASSARTSQYSKSSMRCHRDQKKRHIHGASLRSYATITSEIVSLKNCAPTSCRAQSSRATMSTSKTSAESLKVKRKETNLTKNMRKATR